MIKPSLPKGTRDFAPAVMRKRSHILNIIRQTFELYGFQPLETPAVENLSTLTGKYGEEGDKLIFKILDNGDILGRAQQAKDSRELAALLCEKALRYDLTIPFARFVVMNQQDLALPFRRCQIQPVWRADRPQKGRYREFYQCDADVVGSRSLLNEVELLMICRDVFDRLQLKGYELRINNRKILSGLAALTGRSGSFSDITIAIDKLDKIRWEGVKKELQERGLQDRETAIIENFLHIAGTNEEKLNRLGELFADSETGKKGIEELSFVLNLYPAPGTPSPVIDLTLARGLDYYTGTIIEVKAPPAVKIGSIGGGGRYDDLTGLFGLPGVSGVGISFGVDRIYDVMEELQLFPPVVLHSTRVMFLNAGGEYEQAAFGRLQELRKAGVPAEIFPEAVKFDRQLRYISKRGIPYAAIIAETELKENTVSLKNMETGVQEKIPAGELADYRFS